jgi:two-component system, chemotaxis family, protein-glutamate methylesterase/glutaminase
MEQPAANRLVILGASAGGPLALGDVLADLPDDLDATVVVVLHLHASHPSVLAEVLARRTRLAVTQAQHGERLEPAHVYVAPPGTHLLFDEGDRTLVLDDGPPRRHLRPSIDATFESAAAIFEGETIAVVLTGTGADGSAGAVAVHGHGGTVLAQDAAEFASMPRAAIATGAVDRILPLQEIGPAIVELTGVHA